MKPNSQLAATLVTAFAVIFAFGARDALANDVNEFATVVAPFLKAHCVRCHGTKKHEARLMLHKMTGKIASADAKVWEAVLGQLDEGNMPPEGEPQPDSDEAKKVADWIRETLRTAMPSLPAHELIYPENGNHVSHDLLFPNRTPVRFPATPARIWRVHPSIYESFVEHASREPFHHPFRRESLFSTPWGLDGEGFKDYSDLYWIGEAETELLISNAMRVAEIMSRKRSTYSDESKAFREFLRSRQNPTNDDLKKIISTAFAQIFQREPTAGESERYVTFFAENVEQLGREKGMQTTLAALLLHPKAVFRFELGLGERDDHGRVRLAPGELAYAIAYAVTDRAPDEELLKAARDGSLESDDGIRKQVIRLIDIEQAKMQESYRSNKIGRRHTAPMLRFFQEYFGYTKAPQVFKDIATRRKARLPGNYSPDALVSDTNLLVLHFIDKDKDVLRELLTTDLSFVSTGRGRWNGLVELKKRAKKVGKTGKVTPFDDKRNRINEHYNITPDQWTEDMPFPLDKTQRAGILTQPSWLIAHSTNFENHAIHRGKWIRERLLGGTIPNTPITVDAQLPDDETMTLRERMHVTREAFCWKCHQQMDPLGLSFEMYDHFGRFRTEELGKPVDATGELKIYASRHNGTHESSDREELQAKSPTPSDTGIEEGPVANAVDLMHKLGSSRRVQQVFIRHAFRFFMGRNETVEDASTLVEADRVYTESGGSMKELVASLIASDSFIYRRPIRSRSRETSDTAGQPSRTLASPATKEE